MGRNYGWPNVEGTCNLPAEMTFCAANNVREPLTTWTPTIAPAGLAYYDPGSAAKVTVESSSANTYCISATQGGSTWYKNGPAGRILEVNGTGSTAGGALCSTQ